jgi:outer membrane protein W
MRHVDTTVSSTAPLDVASSRGFGATLEVFVSRNLSVHTAATLVNPEVTSNGVELGTIGIDTYSLGGRYHFRGRSRFSMFAGGGLAIVNVGDLDDQLEDDVYAAFDNEMTYYAEGGVRYRVLPRVVLELGVIVMPLSAEMRVERSNILLPSGLDLDPITVSVAAAYRF